MKNKTMRTLALFALVLLANPFTVFAQRKQVLKIASIAPENTPWGAALNKMASEWQAATNGEIEVRVYHNGVAGDEDDMLRKLRLGQIQGAVFTSMGLNQITPEALTMSCPFVIKDNEEFSLVMDGLKPMLEEKIQARGFVPLAWSKAGWVKIFSKSPVYTPTDLKRLKMGSAASEPELNQAFKTLGYNMVPITMNEVLISLNSGMVDAVYQSPLLIAGLQIFGVANNMVSINIAPFMGAIVLSRNTWRAIPARYRDKIMEINRRIERELDASIQDLEDQAVRTMVSYGLKINQVSPEQEQLWYADTERSIPMLLGTTFDRETFNQIDRILKNHRAGK